MCKSYSPYHFYDLNYKNEFKKFWVFFSNSSNYSWDFFCKIIIKYIILFFFLQYCTTLGFILDSKCTENRPVFDVRHGDEWEKKGALNDSENDEDEKEREE